MLLHAQRGEAKDAGEPGGARLFVVDREGATRKIPEDSMPKLTLVAVLFLASSATADAGLVEVASPTT